MLHVSGNVEPRKLRVWYGCSSGNSVSSCKMEAIFAAAPSLQETLELPAGSTRTRWYVLPYLWHPNAMPDVSKRVMQSARETMLFSASACLLQLCGPSVVQYPVSPEL
jgi:hypothetical protein